MAESGLVRTELHEDGTLLRIILDSPKGNILSLAMMAAVQGALERHAGDKHLRLAVLEGAGGNFSFGASVEEHRKEAAAQMLAGFHRFARELAAYPIPTAALVQGRCLGGAFEVVLCCHFLFAAPNAAFGCPEVRLGVFPPVLAAIGALRLGGGLADRLIIGGETVDTATLERAGAITARVGENAFEDLLAWYRANLKASSAFSLRVAASAARRGSGMLDALAGRLEALERQYLEQLLPSHDGNEGIQAFLERRKPAWGDD